MSYQIQLVETAEQWQLVERLRYEVYVEEMQRNVGAADHSTRSVRDRLDDTGSVFAVFDGQQALGTVRVNSGGAPGIDSYHDLYQLDRFRAAEQQVGIVTKLMVSPSLRGGRLALQLCLEAAREAVRRDRSLMFIDANEHLRRFYDRLGFRPYMGSVHHEEYGHVTPMVIVTSDHDHLRAVRSPLFTVFRHQPRRPETVDCFRNVATHRQAA